ncbi:MAG TPA: M1 family metallopeptidase [Thermoplasmata archaeon]|nr:M1 family metallopeptidase [Thermoplasmata archaeon]
MHVEEYRLDLNLDPQAETFRAEMTASVRGATGPVVFDCAGQEIEVVTVDGARVEATLDTAREKLSIPVPRAGDPTVRIQYRGRARRNVLNGFYVSSFGPGRLLTTMMQPVGCHWLLPCLDQPDQKAVFRLRVTADAEQTVVSNADVERVVDSGGRRTWQFAPTPRMSSYLLYLGIGPFDSIETMHKGVRIAAVAPPGKASLARRALDMAGPLLEEYANYYGLPYPLPKLHLVAVPDLWAGGMENWGAIVFPEIGLLWDDSTSPAIVRWAVEPLSHEIAHQWFGDLVTMRTWDDLWLNESFATFVAYTMEERLGLRANPWAEFLIRTSPGYFSDSYAGTHPVKLTIRDPSEISQSTDDITYFKGGNIVRMIETFLGEPAFRAGVSAYLKRFAFGNAQEEDLWKELEAASGQPVRTVMRAWVDRAGFPVVRVEAADGHLRLTQHRFTFLPDPTPVPPWPIPLRVRDGSTTHRVLFDQASMDLPVENAHSAVLNPGRTSFIRLWYDGPERARRIAALPAADAFDRWAFLNDAFAFVLSGDYGIDDYFEAVRVVSGVTDYSTVDDVVGSLRFLDRAVGDLAAVRPVALGFLRAQRDRLGERRRPGETDTDSVLRQNVYRGLVRFDPAVAKELAPAFDAPDSVDAALRPAAALGFAMQGGTGVVDRLYDRMKTAKRQDDAEQAAHAVEGLPTEEMIRSAVNRCFEEGMRTTNSQYLLRSAVTSAVGRRPVWEWLQKNIRELERRGEGSWMLSNVLEGAIPLMGIVHGSDVEAFFARERFPEATNGVRRGLELLRVVRRLREGLS